MEELYRKRRAWAPLYELYAAGHAAAVLPDTAEVLGRPGRTWEDFATDHATAFTTRPG